jgi:hypothetical protein
MTIGCNNIWVSIITINKMNHDNIYIYIFLHKHVLQSFHPFKTKFVNISFHLNVFHQNP